MSNIYLQCSYHYCTGTECLKYIPFFLGNTLIQVMFASMDYTTISFGIFLYGIFWYSNIVRSLTVRMSLSTWPSCSSSPTISKCTVLNTLRTASNFSSPTIVSMLILHAVNVYVVVFRPFAASVAPRPCVFIIEINFILNDVVTRKTWPFIHIKYNPSC